MVEVLYVPVRSHISHALPTQPQSTSSSAVGVKATSLPFGNEVKVKDVKFTFAPSSSPTVSASRLVVDTSLPTGTGTASAAKITVTGGASSLLSPVHLGGIWGLGVVWLAFGLVGMLF